MIFLYRDKTESFLNETDNIKINRQNINIKNYINLLILLNK